ncbi:unnamed protein product [Meganyctiphanes norvegica]|uniref:Ets DNA-binding protein pokkuri n=1 Tax=Meganyctiphanes norvegica TaxID=48144 RepID=A0AAV2SUG7_MEGNR
MKVPPLNLTPDMNRVGMALPFSPDLLWRYPLPMPSAAPSSPLMDVKNQMPANLAVDPRHWSREDVSAFLRWFEREFELPTIDLTKFCMNGKALCMLNKSDLADRAPGAGDILYNTLQFLLRDAPQVPQSPLTPHHPLLSPSPLTSSHNQSAWPMMSHDLHNFSHILHNGGSVTLSPAPSEQSGGSPRHPDSVSTTSNTSNNSNGAYPHHSSGASTGSGHSGSHSDSEDSTRDSSSPQRSPLPPHSAMSAFPAHALASLKHLSDYQRAAAAAAAAAAANRSQLQESNQQHQREQQQQQAQQHTQHHTQPQQPQQQPQQPTGEEPIETGTNGRLLWDFLQQLLNDPQERYNRYIAWKNRSTGVFKIVDPPGLARLWGIQKNHLSMNYDKMSRALRYYYRVNILRKVQGERHCYQFLRNPSELKNIKNISMLRTQPLQTSPRTKEVPAAPAAPMEEEGPTDLSMPSVHHTQYHLTSPMDSQQQNVPVKIQNEEYLKAIEAQAKNMSVNIKTEEYIEHSYQ